MNKKSFGTVGVAALVVALSAGAALAQGGDTVTFEAPYPFLVNGTEMPAGPYELEVLWRSPGVMRLRNLQTEESVFLQSISRISERVAGEPVLVFDKYQEAYYLAEIHVPDIDGFHLQGAPGEHVHVGVAGQK
jgi:hypothetical protein